MTRLEKLLLRKQKLSQYQDGLGKSYRTSVSPDGTNWYPDLVVLSRALEQVEIDIAQARLEEFLNTDQAFEQEVLSDNSNR